MTMTRKEMIELVKKLQAEGEQCHNGQLELYLTQSGELRTQIISGPHEYREGFAHLMTFQGNDTRDPEMLVDYIELPDGFPPTKDWYAEVDS